MRQRFFVIVSIALLLVSGSAQGGEEESTAKRLLTLEAELHRLLGDVSRLRASLPNDDATVSAEIGAAYEAQLGEPMPPAMLTEATKQVLTQVTTLRRRLVTQIVNHRVAEWKKQPILHRLDKPLVILQVRSGAGGGNPNRVDMKGAMSIYVDERVRKAITWSPTVSIREDSRAYVVGGAIPAGKAFEITRVTWRGVAPGDSNGHGELVVRAGGKTLVESRDDPAVTEGSWEGRLVIRPGQEATVNVEVANSSHVEARFEGRLIDLADADKSGK